MPVTLRSIPLDRILTDDTHRPTPDDLRNSMAAYGMRLPIRVREHPDGSFELSEGSHRLATARALRWKHIDAIVLPTAEATLPKDLEAILINTQRHNLEQLYIARHARRLLEQGLTQARIGRLIHRSQPALSSMLKVLDCPDLVAAITQDGLQFGSARALAALPPAARQHLLRHIRDLQLRDEKLPSVRFVEELVRQHQGQPPLPAVTPANLAAVLAELHALGIPLEIHTTRAKTDRARLTLALTEETEATLHALLTDFAPPPSTESSTTHPDPYS